MTELLAPAVDEATPLQAWGILASDPDTALIDVRSRPEWSIAGMPDLSAIDRNVFAVEWETWPNMTINLGFLSDLEREMAGRKVKRLFFMCRAGVRSIHAAREVARQLHDRGVTVHITNIAEGFEGERNDEGQRGQVSGWKAAGLPWRQA